MILDQDEQPPKPRDFELKVSALQADLTLRRKPAITQALHASITSMTHSADPTCHSYD